jgi:NitT/TauT family transport system ATP-binding protein
MAPRTGVQTPPAPAVGATRPAAAPEPVLTVRGLDVRYGGSQIIQNMNLDVRRGEFVALVGPSGCGKSTFLNTVAGIASSSCTVDGDVVIEPTARLGYAFQKDALLPWFTAKRNVAIAAKLGGQSSAAAQDRTAEELLELVHLKGYENYYPGQMSGGMRQRAALARVMAYEPDLVLLDEPFGGLDAFTRMALQVELSNFWHRSNKTMVLVTHDLAEALVLATRIVVLASHPGRVHCEVAVERPADAPSLEALRSTPWFSERFRELWDVLIALGAGRSGDVPVKNGHEA